MKTKLFFIAIFIFLIILSYKTILRPINISPGDNWVNLADVSVIDFENKLDRNMSSWKEYKDSTTEIKMPIYLGGFNDISATELTRKDEYVANYIRTSNLSTQGRSYWITILRPQHNTQNENIEQWIIKNKLNYIEELNQELPINQVVIGGEKGYQVKMFDNEGMPRIERIYFHTREGIKGIGFYSRSSTKEQVKIDYQVYQNILSTFRFTNQFE